MLVSFKSIKEKNNAGKIPETRIGIGLHYGEAVVGNIGSAIRQQYSITGNVVIIASRIEQLNKRWHSQLIISEEVFNELDAEVKTVFLYFRNRKNTPLRVGRRRPVRN